MNNNRRSRGCYRFALLFIIVIELIVKLINNEHVFDVLAVYAFVEQFHYIGLYIEKREKTDLIMAISLFIVFIAVFVLFVGYLIK